MVRLTVYQKGGKRDWIKQKWRFKAIYVPGISEFLDIGMDCIGGI